MKKMVIFDLDGTLVRGQSQRLFLEYLFKMGIVGLLPCAKLYRWFLLRRVGFEKDPEAIMRYAFSFFRDWRVGIMDILVRDFLHDRLRHAVYREARELIAQHDTAASELVLLSNAFDTLVETTAMHLGIGTAFGTRLERCDDRFTGRLSGSPLAGSAKAHLIQAYAERKKLTFAGSWAYADSISDVPLLELVENPVAVNPDRKLLRVARSRGWKILRFKELTEWPYPSEKEQA